MLLAYRLIATLLVLSISRWMLYLFNLQFFHQLDTGQALALYLQGMRFDLPIVFGINILTIIFYCLPSRIIYKDELQTFVDIIYIVANAIAVLLNFLDIVCFHFFGKHLTTHFLKLLFNSDEVSFGVVRQVFFDHWYLLVIFILFVFGGLQAKPISVETAMQYTDPQNAPILLNTPFCLLTTHETPLKERTGEYKSDFSPIHYDLKSNRFIESDSLTMDSVPSNLVVIILKNVGQEMVGYYSHDRRSQLTPFLDSLLSQSLTFNGMSNSRRSLEVLPAILASIPSMMENDFVRSPYADNDFDAYSKHLQKQGYNTIFMHGGKNGVLGCDEFSRRAGFSKYFGRTEYGDDSDYDGQWGIYDGPFLQYAAKTLNRVHEPFATAIYTLSSRYPYKVPKDFEFPEGSHTLFVITADYSNNEHFQPEYSNVWGMYSIPIAFYYPRKIKAFQSNEIAQQIDLGPSILSALEVNDTLFSFGRNLFDTLSEPSFVSYYNLTYQYCDGTYLVQSDGENSFGIFKPISDSLLNDNLIDRLQCPDVYDKLYRFLQEYNKRMINNELYMTQDDVTRDTSQVDTISQSLVPQSHVQ